MKHDFNPKKNVQIDGISGRSSVRFGQGQPRPRRQPSTHRQPISMGSKRGNTLNDFARKDGFSPTVQPQLRASQVRPQEQIVIDRLPVKKKKGLFGRKHKDQGPKKKLSKKKKLLRVFLVFLVIVLAIGGFLFAKGYITFNKLLAGGGGAIALQKNVDPSKLNGEGDGRINIMMLGRGGEGHEAPDLTDTIIIASIDPIAKEASLVSIPRDMYVKVNGFGSMKINAAFSEAKSADLSKNRIVSDAEIKKAEDAGFATLEETIETTLGIPIHYHVMVDFTGFEQAIDNVGGVSVNAPTAVSENMRIRGKNYFLDVQPGVQDMGGFEALAYSRSRYTSPRGDFDRSERQRIILTALKEKILSVGTFTNPQKISNLLGTLGDHVQTNFSINDFHRLYEIMGELPSDKIGSIGLADPPNNYLHTSNIDGLSVVVPTAGVGNYAEIQSFMRNALKDSFIKDESASVVVLNGTNAPGLATTKGDELKSFGYGVLSVANAPTRTYPTTVIVDLRNGKKKYTKAYLERRFKVTAVNSIPDPAIVPDPAADFVIILGSDQALAQ